MLNDNLITHLSTKTPKIKLPIYLLNHCGYDTCWYYYIPVHLLGNGCWKTVIKLLVGLLHGLLLFFFYFVNLFMWVEEKVNFFLFLEGIFTIEEKECMSMNMCMVFSWFLYIMFLLMVFYFFLRNKSFLFRYNRTYFGLIYFSFLNAIVHGERLLFVHWDHL